MSAPLELYVCRDQHGTERHYAEPGKAIAERDYWLANGINAKAFAVVLPSAADIARYVDRRRSGIEEREL